MTQWKLTRKAWLFILAFAFWPLPCLPATFSDKYDREFERSAKRWMPDLPFWKLLKAQCFQESRLNPYAVSPAGAKGLCQFMSGTFGDVGRELRWSAAVSPFDPDISIDGAGYYMSKLRHTWRRNRTTLERHDVALASYNAGAGHIIKSQKLCSDSRLWPGIQACLHLVTGEKNAHETRTYVERIAKYWRQMELQ